jgi:LTXXQ motif family protein
MTKSIQLTVLAATAMFGLSALAAVAAPAAAGDPTASRPAATVAAKPGANSGMRETLDQRIADLHAKLLITPAQQPQWDAFTQVMRDNANSMEQTFHQRVATLSAMTAPENMQSYAQVAASHAADMQKLVPAFQALYDSMSDSQKKTADAVFRADAHHSAGAHHAAAMRHG